MLQGFQALSSIYVFRIISNNSVLSGIAPLLRFLNPQNGVCQGGILSSRLFSFYVLYDLSLLLCKHNIGCYIDNVCMNHLFDVDAICLLASSAAGIQQLMIFAKGIELIMIFYL